MKKLMKIFVYMMIISSTFLLTACPGLWDLFQEKYVEVNSDAVVAFKNIDTSGNVRYMVTLSKSEGAEDSQSLSIPVDIYILGPGQIAEFQVSWSEDILLEGDQTAENVDHDSLRRSTVVRLDVSKLTNGGSTVVGHWYDRIDDEDYHLHKYTGKVMMFVDGK